MTIQRLRYSCRHVHNLAYRFGTLHLEDDGVIESDDHLDQDRA